MSESTSASMVEGSYIVFSGSTYSNSSVDAVVVAVSSRGGAVGVDGKDGSACGY
jgi:hypothetical protein